MAKKKQEEQIYVATFWMVVGAGLVIAAILLLASFGGVT